MTTETAHTITEKPSVEQSQSELVPQLRFASYNEEWSFKRADEVFSILNGYAFSSKDSKETGVRWIKITDVGINKMRNNNPSYLPSDFKEKHNKFILTEGDYVIALTRPILNNELKIAKITEEYSGSLLNQRVGKLLTNEDLEFVYYILQRNSLISRIDNRIAGTDPPNLSPSEIASLKISIPTLPEQHKIAGFLSSIDTKLQQLTKKKELLEQYKKGVMQQLFSQQLHFKQPDGSNYPDWEEKKLKDVLVEHKTKNKDGVVTEVFSVAKEKGVVNQIEHLGRSYAADSTLHYKVAFPGDIIYTKSPTKDFPFGIIKQNLTGRSGLVSPLYVVTKPETNSLGFIFHCYFLSWVNVYNYLVPLVQKGAKNTMNINNDDFLNGAKFKLPVSKAEQEKISNYLSGLDTKIELVAKALEATKQFKKGLLQQMFV